MRTLKWAVALLLAVSSLALIPTRVKAEETITTVVTTTTTETTTTETTTESDEDRLSEIEAELKRIQDGITADEIDNSTPVKWLEDNLGVSLAGLGAFVLGMIAAVLGMMRVVKSCKEVFSKSGKISDKALKALDEASAEMTELKSRVDSIALDSKSINDETRSRLAEVSGLIGRFNSYVDANRSGMIALCDCIEKVCDEQSQNTEAKI